MNVNKVMMTGRLVVDPETCYTKGKKLVVNFRIAVKGIEKDTYDFFDCITFDGLAKVCEEYLYKGKLIAIIGRLQNRKPSKKSVEIVVDNMQMMDNPKKRGGE